MARQPTFPACRPPAGRAEKHPPGPADESRTSGGSWTWSAAFEAMGDWICIIDTRCIIQRTNQAVERVFNVPADRVPGMHCRTLMHGILPPSRNCPMTRMLASGRRESERMELSDGRWLDISLDPVRSRRGKICGAVLLARDITREVAVRKENEMQLKALGKAVRRIEALSGLLPICSACKRIRDAAGQWILIETFVESHSNASFSHGICPDCMDSIYGDEPWYRPKKGRAKP